MQVYADDAGLLRWEKNDEPVDTSKYHRDDGPNVGIVPISEEEQAEIEARQKERRKKIRDNGGNIPSSSSSSSSSDEAEEIIEGVQPYSDKVNMIQAEPWNLDWTNTQSDRSGRNCRTRQRIQSDESASPLLYVTQSSDGSRFEGDYKQEHVS